MTTPRLVSTFGKDAGDPPGAEVRPAADARTGADVQEVAKRAAAEFAVHAGGASRDTIGAVGIARALGVSEALVRKWLDDLQHFPAWALVKLREVAPEFVAALDARLAATAPLVQRSLVQRSLEARLRRATVAVGDTAQALDRALADGVVDVAEARGIAKESRRGAREFLALADAADAIAESAT